MTAVHVAVDAVDHRDPVGVAVGGEEDVADVGVGELVVGEVVLDHRGDLAEMSALGPHAAVEPRVESLECAGVEVVAPLLEVGRHEHHVDDLCSTVVEARPLLHPDDLSGLDQERVATVRVVRRLVDELASATGARRDDSVVELEVRGDLAFVRLDGVDVGSYWKVRRGVGSAARRRRRPRRLRARRRRRAQTTMRPRPA